MARTLCPVIDDDDDGQSVLPRSGVIDIHTHTHTQLDECSQYSTGPILNHSSTMCISPDN